MWDAFFNHRKKSYLTIFPQARVGYEMIDSQQGVGLKYNHLISNKRDCFIKNNQEMLLDHADFSLQEQAENN